MVSAARRLSATISAASSTVIVSSWLMTDITMFIIICRRRILRCSSCNSSGVWREESFVAGELMCVCGRSRFPSTSLGPILVLHRRRWGLLFRHRTTVRMLWKWKRCPVTELGTVTEPETGPIRRLLCASHPDRTWKLQADQCDKYEHAPTQAFATSQVSDAHSNCAVRRKWPHKTAILRQEIREW